MNNNPIGVFDSGMGGLSVWQTLQQTLHNESLVYLGDGLRCPYGDRSAEEIFRFTVEAVERLREEGCKLIVIACNTATAVAIERLRTAYPDTPFVGLEPAVKPAAEASQTGKIAVLATRKASEGELFLRTSSKFADRVQIIKAVGEGFVELVEQDMEHSDEALYRVKSVIEPLVEQGVDYIVLGCTHYPFLRDAIEQVVGDRPVQIVDSAAAIERRVEYLLDMHHLRADDDNVPQYRFLSFADDDYIASLRKKAFG